MLTTIHTFVATHNADSTSLILGRLTLDTQAHLYVNLRTAHGQVLIPQQGSRVGWWLKGPPAKTLQTLQLQPGTFPIRLRIPTKQLAAEGNYTLRLAAIDPTAARANPDAASDLAVGRATTSVDDDLTVWWLVPSRDESSFRHPQASPSLNAGLDRGS